MMVQHGYFLFAAVVAIVNLGLIAHADDLGEPIDLSGLSEINSAWDEPIDDEGSRPAPVALDPNAGHHRFYVTGIVGASFATLSPSPNPGYLPLELNDTSGSLFNGGVAIGVAFSRSSGQLRMEWEQRLRGPMNGTSQQSEMGGLDMPTVNVYTDNAWSSMVNLWRDYYVNDRVGVYGGGGVGLGGYRSTFSSPAGDFLEVGGADSIATWAWQAGAGVTYRFTDRITADAGYRFFATAPAVNNYSLYGPRTFPVSYSSSLSASELLLSVRIYEPFRNWR